MNLSLLGYCSENRPVRTECPTYKFMQNSGMKKEPDLTNENSVLSTAGAIATILGSGVSIGFGTYIIAVSTQGSGFDFSQLSGSEFLLSLAFILFPLFFIALGSKLLARASLFLVAQHRRGYAYMDISPTTVAAGQELLVNLTLHRMHDQSLDVYAKLLRYLDRDPDQLVEITRTRAQLPAFTKSIVFRLQVPRDAPASQVMTGYLLYVGFESFVRAPLVRAIEVKRT
jgi:hypothetical protein